MIRTRDLYVPNVALYQAEPHSDNKRIWIIQIPSYGKGTWTPTNRVRVCCAANYTIPHCTVLCCFLLFPVSNMVIISDSKKKSSVFLKKMKKWKNCNNSARAIRKTAPRAYCGWRHCFTHKWALSAYRCPLAKTCRHVLCFPYTVWLNCYKKLKIKKTVHGKASDAPFFKLVKSDQASCNAVCKRRYFTSGSSREIHRLSEYTVADLHISFVIFSF